MFDKINIGPTVNINQLLPIIYNTSHKPEIVTRHYKLGYFKNSTIYISSKFVKTLPFSIKGENNTETFKRKVNTT